MLTNKANKKRVHNPDRDFRVQDDSENSCCIVLLMRKGTQFTWNPV